MTVTNLALYRKIYTDVSTIGELYVDGTKVADTIELSCRKANPSGRLAIVPGKYKLILAGSPRLLQVTPRLMEVPKNDGTPGFREGILIHPANWAHELEGCIAPGKYDPSKPDYVADSRKHYAALMERLKKAKCDMWISVNGGRSLEAVA